MKKYILIIMLLLFTILTIRCKSKSVDQLLFQGNSQNWEATMNYNENNKCKFNIKYTGIEKLPSRC